MTDGLGISDLDSSQEIIPDPLLTPVLRRNTFNTGAVPAALSAVSKAKRRLSKIIHERVSLPKSSYIYKSLSANKEIRILRIIKGQRSQKIHCALLTKAFLPSETYTLKKEEDVRYDALSYWWGSDEARSEITINSYVPHQDRPSMFDIEHDTFFIRPNLEAALRQIRSEERDVDIWVDAICINQEDKKERTAQVSRMHEIYNRAQNVRIWLGAGVPETKETFDFLGEILDLQNLDRLIASGEDAKAKWELVVRLMENKWFSRRWVIQELALARNATVLWGSQQMPWSSFADAIALFMTKHDEIKHVLSSKPVYPDTLGYVGDARALGANTLVNATNDLFRKSQDGKIQQRLLPLEVLVSCRFLAFDAPDPKDIIYAVLSVAKDTSLENQNLMARTSCMISSQQMSTGVVRKLAKSLFRHFSKAVRNGLSQVPDPPRSAPSYDPRLAPDYDKSLIDVLADFMDYCIEVSQSLDILCRHWAPPPRKKTLHELLLPSGDRKDEDDEKMPSWIPSIKESPFGGPEDVIRGRLNGDSLVGSPERQNQQHYNASAGLQPCVRFERYNAEEDDQIDNFTHQSSLHQLPARLQKIICISPPLQPWPSSKKYTGTLYVKGFRIDTITELSARVCSGMIEAEAFNMGGWPINCTSLTVPVQLWRTLVADRGPNGISAPAWYRRACRECLTLVDAGGNLNTQRVRDLDSTPSTIKDFLDRVQRVTWNRKFFRAVVDGNGGKERSSRFGLAPAKAKEGDLICVLFGCSVPVLLRQIDGSGNHPQSYFELIGECYVYGYMDGEAVPCPRPEYPYDKAGAEEFNLR